jgi:hypothetical protein
MQRTHYYKARPECRKFSTTRQKYGIPAALKTALTNVSLWLQIVQNLKDTGLYRRIWHSCNSLHATDLQLSKATYLSVVY